MNCLKKKKKHRRKNLEKKDFNYKLDYGKTIFGIINVFCVQSILHVLLLHIFREIHIKLLLAKSRFKKKMMIVILKPI